MTTTQHIDVILYVDDDPANRLVFETTFAPLFPIRCAASGGEALAILAETSVAVLVTDQRMPEMTGHELLRRAREQFPDTVRVVITAYSDVDAILGAVNEGLVARYLIKPWDSAELTQILRWAMEAFRLGRESATLQKRLLESERLITLGRIAGSVVHELRQPLAYLNENAKRLVELAVIAPRLAELAALHRLRSPAEQNLLETLAVELPEIASDLVQGCETMLGVTNSLHLLLRPSATDDPPSADPHSSIRFALAACRQLGLQAHAELIYEGPQALPAVRMRPTELSQVLINLIANAAQALGRRSHRGGRVEVRGADMGRRIEIAIVDNGPGMAPDVLAQVGTPFFSTRADGTGLGVAQCRQLVHRSGGELHIDSTVDVGTTVRVILDAAVRLVPSPA